MNELIITNGITGLVGTFALAINGEVIRDEVSAWATLICSIVITCTTVGLQVYHMIRDRDKDKNKPAEAEKNEKENDGKDG